MCPICLAAEIERWQAVASQGIAIEREIRIEIERLRAERDDLMNANALLHALIGNREAEIERLRAALKQITSGGLGLFGSKEVARAALDKIDAALEQKSP